MNDFTKEELKEMYDGLYFEGWMAETKNNPHYPLMRKIQSMIDNYCENKCDHNFKLCTYFYGNPDNKYRCSKCLIAYEDLNEKC